MPKDNKMCTSYRMNGIFDTLNKAVEAGSVLPSSLDNIKLLLEGSVGESAEVARLSLKELVAAGQWSELNDRFFKTLAFGTGGLRGRTIGSIITKAEQGKGGPNGRPEFPCTGTTSMNYYNLSRAIRGLISYVKTAMSEAGVDRKPRLVIGHDTRHFSRDFAEFCAKVCVELGCDAYLFDAPRSTPQVSFAIREMNADTGIVLTASHNPSHDNGFKAYWNDGGQVVPPHDMGIICDVNALDSEAYEALPTAEQGTLTVLGAEADALYTERLRTLLFRPELFEDNKTRAKVVYSNLHGTGGHIIVPLLKSLGCNVVTVPEQDVQDGRFPTVKSPNPENAAALAMAIELADRIDGEIVIATDPDCDRMGVAVRDSSGKMKLLTGNQIGSLLGWLRCQTMFEKGILTDSTRSHATMVKTLVTTTLQDDIARHFGIGVVNTLTGFKYIAAKLAKYEAAIPADKRGNYREKTEEETRALRLEYSRFFVFGGEESYGYLACDFVRDKDANAAALLFAELAAYAKSIGSSILQLMNKLYYDFGVHLEVGKALEMSGADGAAKIAKLAESYSSNPPTELDGAPVSGVRDYAHDDFYDSEGDLIPKEKMIFVDLEDGRCFAVRPSGTEPKIKYYLYYKGTPGLDVSSGMATANESLASLWTDIEKDARARMA